MTYITSKIKALGALALALCVFTASGARISSRVSNPIRQQASSTGRAVAPPTYAGYVNVDADGSSIYYAYYESHQRPAEDEGEVPVVLWLQVGGQLAC